MAPASTEDRFNEVVQRLHAAAKKAGKGVQDIRLVASSRGLMADPVTAAARAGTREFAEDYLPEGVTKRPVVDHAVKGLTWHFTGTLPAPKLGVAVEFFDWIHTVDRLSLLRQLHEAMEEKEKKHLHILIEVNPLGVQKRLGVSPDELPALVEGLRAIPGLSVEGLSFKTERGISFPDGVVGYQKTAELFHGLRDKKVLPWTATTLAMGTSRDFERAVELGSTLIRVGQAIFGRPASAGLVEV